MKTALLTLLLSCVPAFAQDSMVADLAKHLKISKDYTIAVAQQMPAESYGFKPNPEEMSFGEQMNHIASANSMFGGMFKTGKPKEYKTADKDAVIASLKESFDSAIANLSALSDADMHKVVKSPEGDMSIVDGALLMLDHTTHHRAQCIVYLRVKGIKPTDYRF